LSGAAKTGEDVVVKIAIDKEAVREVTNKIDSKTLLTDLILTFCLLSLNSIGVVLRPTLKTTLYKKDTQYHIKLSINQNLFGIKQN
jgi:hypothetical protein